METKETSRFRIRVLGSTFEIRPGGTLELRGRMGFMDGNKREIVYAGHVHDSAIKETIFHELIHCADMMTATLDTELSEEQTTRISVTLFGILRDHPEVVHWLTDESGIEMPEDGEVVGDE